MSTLHRFAEAAVRRDLHRARVVLSSGGQLYTDRRVALCEHLVWMTGLIDGEESVVDTAARRVRTTAYAFRDEGDRARRTDVIGAIGSLHRVTGRHTGWISAEADRRLCDQVPWLLDGAARHVGAGLVLDADARRTARERAEAYRDKRLAMWGPIVLHELAGSR